MYTPDVPHVPNEEVSPGGDQNGGPDGGNDGEAGISGSPGDKGSGNGPGAEGGSNNAGQRNQGPDAGSGGPGSGSGNAEGGLGENKAVVELGTPSSSASDDSSSPLAPILIAIAVLAAISIGAYYYRQRRQGAGSPISPKAS